MADNVEDYKPLENGRSYARQDQQEWRDTIRVGDFIDDYSSWSRKPITQLYRVIRTFEDGERLVAVVQERDAPYSPEKKLTISRVIVRNGELVWECRTNRYYRHVLESRQTPKYRHVSRAVWKVIICEAYYPPGVTMPPAKSPYE